MKNSHKALLYSAAIFPGSGHFLLRQIPMGLVFTAIAAGSLVAMISQVLLIANDISNRILNGEIPFDIARILQEVSTQTADSIWSTGNIAIWVLLVCWIVAAIDAYRLGRRQDQLQSTD